MKDDQWIESRYNKGKVVQIRENGINLNNKERKQFDVYKIPSTANIIIDKDPDSWCMDLPKGQDEMKLTFNDEVNVTTNSIYLDVKSITVHQYTMQVFENSKDKNKEEDHDGILILLKINKLNQMLKKL